MDVGLELRQARERRGLSLHQISTTTKISLRVLQAIEAADESRLPAPVFTRSFVKAYAHEVGLEPDGTMQRYFEQLAPPAPAFQTDEPAEPPASAQPPPNPAGWPRARVLRGRFGTPALLLAVAVTAFTLAARNYRELHANETHREAEPGVGAAGSKPAGSRPPAAVATTGATPAPRQLLQVEIAPTGPCWVQATVEGQSVLAALLNAGDRKTIDAPSGVTLRVGDPAAFAFAINGKPARISGPPGHAVTIHLTRENYATFVTPPGASR